MFAHSSSSSSSSQKDLRYWSDSKLTKKLSTTQGIVDNLRDEIRELERWVSPVSAPHRSASPRGNKYEQLAHLREELDRVLAKRDDIGRKFDYAARAVRNPLESKEYKAEALYESRLKAAQDDELQADESYLRERIRELEDGRAPQYIPHRAMLEQDDDSLTDGQKDLQMKRRVLAAFLEDEKAYKLESLHRGSIKTRTVYPSDRQYDLRGRSRSPSLNQGSRPPLTRSYSRQRPSEPDVRIVYDDEPLPGEPFGHKVPAKDELGRRVVDSSHAPYSFRLPAYLGESYPSQARRSSPSPSRVPSLTTGSSRSSSSFRRYSTSPPATTRVTRTIYHVLPTAPSKPASLPGFNIRAPSPARDPYTGRIDPFQFLDAGSQPAVAYSTPRYQTFPPAYSNTYCSTDQRVIDGKLVTVREVAPRPHVSEAPSNLSYYTPSAHSSKKSGKSKGSTKKKIVIIRRRK